MNDDSSPKVVKIILLTICLTAIRIYGTSNYRRLTGRVQKGTGVSFEAAHLFLFIS